MKKYIAIIAACAVVGVAGVAVVKNHMASPDENKTTADAGASYSQSADGETTKKTVSDEVSSSQSSSVSKSDEDAVLLSFTGVIESVDGSTVTVVPDKGESVRSSADKITFGLDSAELTDESGAAVRADDAKNFAKVKVYYKDGVRETYPASVDAQKIVLLEREYCNVYFYSDKNELIKTLRVKVGDSLESADMPNGGAYCPDGYHFVGWEYGSEIVDGIKKLTKSATLKAVISQD
ncbi:MAG: hypothetical protein ACI4XH_06405 [Acutalibacteraceae bacterium]